ncbi:MAG TPA: hypothetical protein VF589_04090 [Allosphingosinicella sp.]
MAYGLIMKAAALPAVTLPQLSSALEASWDRRTAYLGACRPANPALGQCYPTSRVVQWFFPRLEIASGEVDTGSGFEAHFWNVDPASNPARHVDLTWRQFAPGSKVARFEILDRDALNDTPPTIARCELLLSRVLLKLEAAGAIDRTGGAASMPALGGHPPNVRDG